MAGIGGAVTYYLGGNYKLNKFTKNYVTGYYGYGAKVSNEFIKIAAREYRSSLFKHYVGETLRSNKASIVSTVFIKFY